MYNSYLINHILWKKILGKPMNSLTGLLSRGFKIEGNRFSRSNQMELLFTAGGDDRRQLRLLDGRRIDTCPFPYGGEVAPVGQNIQF